MNPCPLGFFDFYPCEEELPNETWSFLIPRDPSDLPRRRYVLPRRIPGDTVTEGGYWKEKHFTAIREERPGEDQSKQQQYAWWAQKTYRFHKSNNTQTKWWMHEYYPLNPHSDLPGLVLEVRSFTTRSWQS